MTPATRRVGFLWLLIAIVTALYWPTALSYARAWNDFDNRGYTHGYLIALMCLALIYLRREELTGPLTRAPPWAYGALALVGLGWLLAYRAGIQTAHQLLFPVVLWWAIYAVCGGRIARRCLFAVGFLYFALPFWGSINPALQDLTVIATHFILHLMGLPVRFYGNLVQIPEGTFVIEGGCSGLHFMVVGLAMAAYYGELHRDSLRQRLLLLGLAGALALLTNWIRVSVIITAGHLTDMQSYLVRVSHYGFGWAVFAVAMAVFFLIGSRLPPRPEDAMAQGAKRMEAGSAPALGGRVLAFAALALAPALCWAAMRGDAAAAAAAAPTRLASVPDWTGPLAVPSDWHPIFVGADSETRATYRRGAATVEWYMADYAYQRQGRKLLGYNNSLLGVGGFTVLEAGRHEDGSGGFVQLHLHDPDGAQSLLWYRYGIGSRTMTSGLRAQLWYGVSSLAGPVDSRIIAFHSKCAPDCAAALERLGAFVASICSVRSRFDNCRRDP